MRKTSYSYFSYINGEDDVNMKRLLKACLRSANNKAKSQIRSRLPNAHIQSLKSLIINSQFFLQAEQNDKSIFFSKSFC